MTKHAPVKLLDKDKVTSIVSGWQVKTSLELCEELKMTPEELQKYVNRIRITAGNHGVSLGHRKRILNYNTQLIMEVLKAKKLIK